MKQSKGDEEVQMFFADILQRVGLYAYRGNLVDMLTAIREDQSALELVGDGAILLRVDYQGMGKMQGDLPGGSVFRGTVLDSEVEVIGNHTDVHMVVIVHLALNVVVISFPH